MATAAVLVPLLFGAASAAGGYLLSRTQGRIEIPGSAPTPLPQSPSPEDAAQKASDKIRQRKAAMTQSIYTSPLGVSGQADVVRKTLLGQ